MTGPQIRHRLARLVVDAEPEAFIDRHRAGMRDRCVHTSAGDPGSVLNGMGSLWLRHSGVDIAAIDSRVTGLAKAEHPNR